MATKINYIGRLGNNLFQYIVAYLFSIKHDLELITDANNNGLDFGTFFKLRKKDHGRNFASRKVEVTNDNFIKLFEADNLDDALYEFSDYYQLKDFVLQYRHSIKAYFSLKINKRDDGEFVIHYRVKDIDGLRHVIPLEYYEEAISKFKDKRGYIISDDISHKNVDYLVNKYNLIKVDYSPLESLDFAKNFNNIILSEGTFSFWIGFLSDADNIYYNERERFWHGDIFILNDWKPLKYDYAEECIVKDNKLICKTLRQWK